MALNPDSKGKEFTPPPFNYTEKDVILYHLGVSAFDLKYTYEKNLRILPSFAVIPAFSILFESLQVTGANPMNIVHGEQVIKLNGPIPPKANTRTAGKVREIYDKGKGALLVIDAVTRDDGGKELFTNTYSLFARGEGGFGGERGPPAGNVAPDRDPDHVVEYETLPFQHKIYRLSGDINPLHIDPDFAKMAGFPKPIQHGLCTFGFVCRAVLNACCDDDPNGIVEYGVRFTGEVYPGEKIITKIWKDEGKKVLIQAEKPDGKVVVSNAYAILA